MASKTTLATRGPRTRSFQGASGISSRNLSRSSGDRRIRPPLLPPAVEPYCACADRSLPGDFSVRIQRSATKHYSAWGRCLHERPTLIQRVACFGGTGCRVLSVFDPKLSSRIESPLARSAGDFVPRTPCGYASAVRRRRPDTKTRKQPHAK
jgi:hypothetical protein